MVWVELPVSGVGGAVVVGVFFVAFGVAEGDDVDATCGVAERGGLKGWTLRC